MASRPSPQAQAPIVEITNGKTVVHDAALVTKQPKQKDGKSGWSSSSCHNDNIAADSYSQGNTRNFGVYFSGSCNELTVPIHSYSSDFNINLLNSSNNTSVDVGRDCSDFAVQVGGSGNNRDAKLEMGSCSSDFSITASGTSNQGDITIGDHCRNFGIFLHGVSDGVHISAGKECSDFAIVVTSPCSDASLNIGKDCDGYSATVNSQINNYRLIIYGTNVNCANFTSSGFNLGKNVGSIPANGAQIVSIWGEVIRLSDGRRVVVRGGIRSVFMDDGHTLVNGVPLSNFFVTVGWLNRSLRALWRLRTQTSR